MFSKIEPARAFAYLVLDTAASAHRTDAANQRTFNIGIKAVKECLLVDNGDALVEIGTKIVEQLAAKLEGVSPELRTQYLLLRVLLVWHTLNRLFIYLTYLGLETRSPRAC